MPDPYLLERDESLLCIVDIQEKLAARMAEKESVIERARMLTLAARRLGIPIIVTEQYPRGLGPTVMELTIALEDAYAPIEKICFGCGADPAFMDQLKGRKRKQVVLCGMETHVCILQTCLDLLDRGYKTQVVADATCSRYPAHKEIGLGQMRQMGGVVTCAESVVFQWLGKAGTEEFKDLLPLFK
jgi:nicotinamidase-related amidase